MAARLRVTQVKSTISHIARNRATVRALGLKRIGHTVEIPDNPATRGMVRQVRFLVSVEEVGGAAAGEEKACNCMKCVRRTDRTRTGLGSDAASLLAKA